MPRLPALALLPFLAGMPALADAPRVATDVPPIHALVAQVMAGVGTPELVVPPTASPHDFSLRPSDASVLQGAELLIWIGPELSPGVTRAVQALSDAPVLTLLDAPGTNVLGFREGPVFGDHGDEEHDGEEHDGEEHEGEDGHDHGGRDPHAWLDPENAVLWLPLIAARLSGIDPDNAATYAANAEAAVARIADQQAGIAARMQALPDRPFVVFHDAYHYFEARFGVEAAGSIALGDGTVPGPRRLAEIRDRIGAEAIACAFAEPQFNADLVEVAFADAGARIAVIDPLGSRLQPGPMLYAELLEGIVSGFETCLGAE